MKRLIGAAIVTAGVAFAGIASSAAIAAPQTSVSVAGKADVSDFSARRYVRRTHRHVVYRPFVQPYYYARPTYYRPYPYASPVPFFLGIGFGPSW